MISSIIRFFKKNPIMTYSLICFTIIISSYILTPSLEIKDSQIRVLTLKDALFVFVFNTAIFLVLISLSFTGLPLLLLISFLIKVGATGKHSFASFWVYYGSSFIHLALELFVYYIVTLITIRNLAKVLLYFANNDINLKLEFPRLKAEIFTVIVVLFFAALVEVFVSNRLFLLLSS